MTRSNKIKYALEYIIDSIQVLKYLPQIHKANKEAKKIIEKHRAKSLTIDTFLNDAKSTNKSMHLACKNTLNTFQFVHKEHLEKMTSILSRVPLHYMSSANKQVKELFDNISEVENQRNITETKIMKLISHYSH